MKKLGYVVLATVVLLGVAVLPVHAAGRGGSHFQHHGFQHHGFHHSGFRHPGFHPGFHHHPFFGARVFVGVGPVFPVWWGAPVYAAPPVVVQQAPPVYVQDAPPAQSYWYYCEGARAYYPYVQQCPGGWLKVVPSPAPSGPSPY